MSFLKGKTALVTGATRGIGRVTAIALGQGCACARAPWTRRRASARGRRADTHGAVLLSSLAAPARVGDLRAHAATRGRFDTLVKHFAAAFGGRGIRANAVAPGVIDGGSKL